MTTQTQANQDYGVEIGITKIKVPHDDKNLVFVSPSKGPGTYKNTMQAVLNEGLGIPTGDYTASLVHAVYCGPEDFKESAPVRDVRNIIRKDWLWVANNNLWVPGENAGVFAVYDENGKGRDEKLDQGKLEKALETAKKEKGVFFSEDGKVRFAPRDTYEGGVQSPEDFADNGFVIVSYGVKGAEKLAEASKECDYKPRVWILNPNKPEQRVSALGEDDERLLVGGDYFDDGDRGHALGVLK